jgi:hypothetical protein
MADKDDFLATARRRFEAAAEDEKELRRKFVSDLKFASPDGEDQWDPQLKLQREQAGRPAMSFPRCHTFVQQVSNEARDKKPQVKFAPQRDVDKDTAEIYEGMARYIQYCSDAQVAYETALEYSAGGSFGYYRFLTDYVDDESDDLELIIKPVLDPLTVYGILVPSIFGRKPTYWFVVEDIPKEEYKSLYPDSELSSISWEDAETRGDGWVGSDSVRIAEYWTVEEKRIKGKRKPQITIKFCKINGVEILPGDDGEPSTTTWPGTLCNIIPVLGKQMIIEGKPQLSSIVRPQKSAQQLINYSKSRIAETLSQAPVSPFIAAEGQLNGYEKQWEALNTAPRPVLFYKPVDANGQAVGPPQRQTFEPPIQALSAFVSQEVDDMKATTGIYDASLGNSGNETSGQAIVRRQQQTNLTTMHFMDNLERSFKRAGEIIEELIPKIYDTEREVQILGSDEEPRTVLINQEHADESGATHHYKIADSRIKLVITAGKAYGSKRAESFDTISQVVQTSPNMFPMIGDILFRNSDMAGSDELAERFHKMLPPALQNDDNNPLPPQAQAAVAQAQQQVQALQGELQKLMFERQAKVVEVQGKMQQIAAQSQADLTLENRKMETQITVAEIEAKSQIAQERAQFVEDLWKQFHKQAHESGMAAQEHGHDLHMADQQAQHARQAAEQQAAITTQQSAMDAQNAAQQTEPQSAQV